MGEGERERKKRILEHGSNTIRNYFQMAGMHSAVPWKSASLKEQLEEKGGGGGGGEVCFYIRPFHLLLLGHASDRGESRSLAVRCGAARLLALVESCMLHNETTNREQRQYTDFGQIYRRDDSEGISTARSQRGLVGGRKGGGGGGAVERRWV